MCTGLQYDVAVGPDGRMTAQALARANDAVAAMIEKDAQRTVRAANAQQEHSEWTHLGSSGQLPR